MVSTIPNWTVYYWAQGLHHCGTRLTLLLVAIWSTTLTEGSGPCLPIKSNPEMTMANDSWPAGTKLFSGSTGKGSKVWAVANKNGSWRSQFLLVPISNQLPNWSFDCFFRSSKRCIVQCRELFLFGKVQITRSHEDTLHSLFVDFCCVIIRFSFFAIWGIGFLKSCSLWMCWFQILAIKIIRL